jgi:uncharacterized protein (DUF1501 family)
MKRREFLRQSSLASGVFLVPSFLKSIETLPLGTLGYKSLVIVQLSGGNDGLNTIVPYKDDIYYRSRPTLAIGADKVLRLTDYQGFNPALASLREIYDQGWMTIINDVGYPNPNRSHFRSTDIWHTASGSDQYLNTGWIGRYLDSDCPDCKNAYNAIEVGEALSLAMKGEHKKGIAVNNPDVLYSDTRQPFFRELAKDTQPSLLSEDNLGYLYKTLIETTSAASYIYKTSKLYRNTFEYPQSAFAAQLKQIATFIHSGLKSRVYYVSLSGFDTHVRQTGRQERLLEVYADGIAAFLRDLKSGDRLDDTLVMTFSEFGRRVAQNASDGTDHGTANNVHLFGGGLRKPGVFNDPSNLTDLDEGDLKFKIDFRNIYASALSEWLGVDNSGILNAEFTGLGIVKV